MCPMMKSIRDSDNTASTITTDTWEHDSGLSAGLYGDDTNHNKSYKQQKLSIEPLRRRGGVLFQENNAELHPVKYNNAKKGIMKVASLEDSLRSCKLHQEQEGKIKRRSSLNLDSLTTALRNLIAPPPRSCVSCSGGMDLDEAADDNTLGSSCESLRGEPQVRFANIHTRMYPVAPDDNPSATGKAAAIALAGWDYTTTKEPVSVDDYEATKGPHRRRMEDLKMDWMERRRRLLEAGASSSEIQDFARRIHKAKVQRQETAQAFSLYGKQHLARMERREKVGRFFKRAFGLRKTNSKNQAALWDQAQQELPAIQRSLTA